MLISWAGICNTDSNCFASGAMDMHHLWQKTYAWSIICYCVNPEVRMSWSRIDHQNRLLPVCTLSADDFCRMERPQVPCMSWLWKWMLHVQTLLMQIYWQHETVSQTIRMWKILHTYKQEIFVFISGTCVSEWGCPWMWIINKYDEVVGMSMTQRRLAWPSTRRMTHANREIVQIFIPIAMIAQW